MYDDDAIMFNALTIEYTNWLNENKLPKISADDLMLAELDEDEYELNPEQREWVGDFINRWNELERTWLDTE